MTHGTGHGLPEPVESGVATPVSAFPVVPVPHGA
jgi:hypothetical protein